MVVEFDQREGSSDGGAVLLKAADRRYGLTERLAACLQDERQAGKIDQELRDSPTTGFSPPCRKLFAYVRYSFKIFL